MSYILDALKKADAQRERDPARGIHAQPAPLPTVPEPGIGGRPWFWVTGVAAIAVLAVAGWFVSQGRSDPQRSPEVASDAEPPRTAAVPAAAPAPLGATPPPRGTTAAAPEPVADAVLPPPAPVAPAVVAAAPPGAATTPTGNAARAAAAVNAPVVPAVPASATAAPPPAPPAATAAAPTPPPVAARPVAPAPAAAPAAPVAAGEPPVGNGLPADAPRLAISGGVYSANRAQRMLIVNGQVVNEGADLGGGIVLEEIRPKAAVLRFRGGRYNVGF